jgi:hypothetical protein
MHRTLFLLSTIVLTYSVHTMDFTTTLQTKQIAPVVTQFKMLKEREEQKQERSAYTRASRLNIMNGNTDATAECFMRLGFDKTVAKASLPEVHDNFLKIPKTVRYAVLNYNNKDKPCNKDKSFYAGLASLPEELRYTLIVDHLFAGNKEAAAVFNSMSYGKALLNLAYALEGVKNNPIPRLTSSEQLGLAIKSPEVHRLCIKMNKSWTKGEWPKLTLHEERFLAIKMPHVIVKKMRISSRLVACQLPYRKRLPTFKEGLVLVSAIAGSSFLMSIVMGGCSKTAALLNLIESPFTIGVGECITGTITGTVASIVYILYEISKSYPLQKTIYDIVSNNNKLQYRTQRPYRIYGEAF